MTKKILLTLVVWLVFAILETLLPTWRFAFPSGLITGLLWHDWIFATAETGTKQ